jgi:hypothetical protein
LLKKEWPDFKMRVGYFGQYRVLQWPVLFRRAISKETAPARRQSQLKPFSLSRQVVVHADPFVYGHRPMKNQVGILAAFYQKSSRAVRH